QRARDATLQRDPRDGWRLGGPWRRRRRGAARGPPPPRRAGRDAVLDFGVRSGRLEVAGSVARQPGWRPALDARATDASEKLAQRLADARWQVPTVAELEREFPGSPVRALLSHFARTGTAEPIDAE